MLVRNQITSLEDTELELLSRKMLLQLTEAKPKSRKVKSCHPNFCRRASRPPELYSLSFYTLWPTPIKEARAYEVFTGIR